MKSNSPALSTTAKAITIVLYGMVLTACDSSVEVASNTTNTGAYLSDEDLSLDMDDEPTGPTDFGINTELKSSRADDSSNGLSDINDFKGGADAYKLGAWSPAASWPLAAIHAALLPSGQVLTYGTDVLGQRVNAIVYDVWNPTLGMGAVSHTTLDNDTQTNMFCSAQGVLGNGEVLISGGDGRNSTTSKAGDGIRASSIFNPITEKLETGPTMHYPRWYPTMTGLPNGETLIMGGRPEKPEEGRSYGVATPEIYNTDTREYRLLTGATSEMFETSWYYPRAFVGKTGRVFIFRNGSKEVWSLDWTGNGSVRKDITRDYGYFSNQYPSVMYRPGKVLALTSNRGAKLLDISTDTPVVEDTNSPGLQRIFSDMTIMANGQVLLTGGSTVNQDLDTSHYKAQIWAPQSQQWRDGASAAKARLYHSTALLLPNGAVLVAGGGPPGPVVNLNAEIYYPPYLFKKDGSGDMADRPVITSMPNVAYGRKFKMQYKSDKKISRVAMIRAGSVTHSFDQSQRYVPLSFQSNSENLLVDGPADGNIAPPGQYMLVIIDEDGVPSHAEMFQPIF